MKQEEEKAERERSRPPRPCLGQERRWEILGGCAVLALARPSRGLLRAEADSTLESGVSRLPRRGVPGAVGEGLVEAATAGGQGLLWAASPRRGPTGS